MHKKQENGRSMIEMLGVLAIIGVLTVGSITAYSKVMRRHLLNCQTEQINYILSAVETNFDSLNLSSSSNLPYDIIPVFTTLGWIPQEMIKEKRDYIYDIFNNKIQMYFSIHSQYLAMIVSISNNIAYEQCVNLYQVTKQYHSSLWMVSIYMEDDSVSRYTSRFTGDKYCTTNCVRDLTLSQIANSCHVCNASNRCEFGIMWK